MAQRKIPDFLKPCDLTQMSISLPSRGMVYADKKEKVTLRAMTLADESILTSQHGVNGLDFAIDAILSRCIEDNLAINTLLVADKYYLFLMLRAVSFGAEYTFEWSCDATKSDRGTCSTKNTTKVDLIKDYKVKRLSNEDTEPFKATLPASQKEVNFRLQRVFDQTATQTFRDEQEAMASTQSVQPNNTAAYAIARLLVSIDGNDIGTKIKTEDVMAWVNSLPAKDSAYLNSRIEFYTPGIDTTTNLVCSQCGNKQVVDLPITGEFFRPKFTD